MKNKSLKIVIPIIFFLTLGAFVFVKSKGKTSESNSTNKDLMMASVLHTDSIETPYIQVNLMDSTSLLYYEKMKDFSLDRLISDLNNRTKFQIADNQLGGFGLQFSHEKMREYQNELESKKKMDQDDLLDLALISYIIKKENEFYQEHEEQSIEELRDKVEAAENQAEVKMYTSKSMAIVVDSRELDILKDLIWKKDTISTE